MSVAERAESVAGRGRIGGIGFDENGRTIAAQQVAGEVFRNVDHELHLAAREQVVRFLLGRDLLREIEVGAVLHRVEQRASMLAAIREEDGGRQMARIGVDRVTEKRELDAAECRASWRR